MSIVIWHRHVICIWPYIHFFMATYSIIFWPHKFICTHGHQFFQTKCFGENQGHLSKRGGDKNGELILPGGLMTTLIWHIYIYIWHMYTAAYISLDGHIYFQTSDKL